MASPSSTSAAQDVPLCVDLDGTVIRTDSLVESILAAVKARPYRAILLPFWILRGKPYFKEKVAQEGKLDPATLPYNTELLEYLKQQKSAGRTLILATGANESVGRSVFDHLGIFDLVLASDGQRNLTGRKKCEELISRYGARGFDYVGDSDADLHVWSEARNAVLVNCSQSTVNRVQLQTPVVKTFSSSAKWTDLLRALRVHQWSKNLIVFLPLVASHRVFDPRSLLSCITVFIAFCLCASGAYILNDLLDLPSDRRHTKKRHRPFASGAVPIWLGLLWSPALMILGIALGFVLRPSVGLVLLTYIFLTVAYSSYFRSVTLIDVFILATLYTIRVIGGHEAAQIVYSNWLLGFSIFFFLSLGLLKRATEVRDLRQQVVVGHTGRGYQADDLEILTGAGLVSGGMAVLILAVYVTSPDVAILYKYPYLMLLLCPLLFYWLIRIWMLVHRGEMHADPVVFALRDKTTYYLLAIVALVVFAASKHTLKH
jgi:4-hydroxybenzoate polyprenyltransferase/phosphoglycolate phosphatase-like HAD superfamily hydrolase